VLVSECEAKGWQEVTYLAICEGILAEHDSIKKNPHDLVSEA
jgi:hypothetical protein